MGLTAPSHGGSLPGTTTLLVRSSHDFAWAALFNARAQTGNFDGELDAALAAERTVRRFVLVAAALPAIARPAWCAGGRPAHLVEPGRQSLRR